MQVAELRPMSLGQLLDRTFSLYRGHFLLFVGIMALPNLLLLMANLVSQLISTFVGLGASSGIIAGIVIALLGLVGYLVTIAVAQAATVFAVSELHLGRSVTIGQSYARVKGRFWRMVDVMVTVFLRVFIGFIMLIVPGVRWGLKYSLAIPAAMLEDVKARVAMERSAKLTEGSWGRIALIIVLVYLLAYAAAMIFQGPIIFLMAMAMQGGGQVPPWMTTFSHLGEFLANTLVGPVGTIAFSLMYYDERVRKEAFDLQLMMQTLDGTPASPQASAETTQPVDSVIPRQLS